MAYTRKTSATQINLYNKCPFAYYIQYKLKLKPPLTFALVKGSLLHAVLEKFYDINIRSSGVNKFNYQDEFQKHIFNVPKIVKKITTIRILDNVPFLDISPL